MEDSEARRTGSPAILFRCGREETGFQGLDAQQQTSHEEEATVRQNASSLNIVTITLERKRKGKTQWIIRFRLDVHNKIERR